MASALPNFDPFDIHADGAIAQCWQKWIKRLENLFVAAAITDKKRQRALLFCNRERKGHGIFRSEEECRVWNLHVSASPIELRRVHECVSLVCVNYLLLVYLGTSTRKLNRRLFYSVHHSVFVARLWEIRPWHLRPYWMRPELWKSWKCTQRILNRQEMWLTLCFLLHHSQRKIVSIAVEFGHTTQRHVVLREIASAMTVINMVTMWNAAWKSHVRPEIPEKESSPMYVVIAGKRKNKMLTDWKHNVRKVRPWQALMTSTHSG